LRVGCSIILVVNFMERNNGSGSFFRNKLK
jgi:hypothetical protein